MMWNFLLSQEEFFLEFNSNLLETNLFNLLILIGLLIYASQIALKPTLNLRREDISEIIDRAQKDVLDAGTYYSDSEKGLVQSIFWLKSWKSIYQTEKVEFVSNKHKIVETGLKETFRLTENLIKNFETKSFLSLRRYILFFIASRILRKFLFLSEIEQSTVLEGMIIKLRGDKK